MTSSYNIPSKYKAYVGRVFILRKYKLIPASKTKKAGKREYVDRMETFGESCVVLDETNSKAHVTCLDGTKLWIPKYYLHTEIESSSLKDINTLRTIVSKLAKNVELKDEDKCAIMSYLTAHIDHIKDCK